VIPREHRALSAGVLNVPEAMWPAERSRRNAQIARDYRARLKASRTRAAAALLRRSDPDLLRALFGDFHP
jgi:hypothetical protein